MRILISHTMPYPSLTIVTVSIALMLVSCPSTTDSLANQFAYVGKVPVIPSEGKVWPHPQHHVTGNRYWVLDEPNFQFVSLGGPSCPLVREAYQRYTQMLFRPVRKARRAAVTRENNNVFMGDANFAGRMQTVAVLQTSNCEEVPYLDMNERYDLKIDENGANITSTSVWGIIRALETFSQLTFKDPTTGNIIVKQSEISDYPRFAHRGVLLDTARHFVPKHIIMQNLDVMAYNKFNVFHWHIVDDQSFPYQSNIYPEMSGKGAYNPSTHIYTIADVKDIVEHARVRGIRVIPEFDTPAHTFSWGNGAPQIMTECFTSDGNVVPNWFGPLNPILESTYTFMKGLFSEITQIFPDTYLHLGGDEVTFNCWMSNPDIKKFMMTVGFGTDYKRLMSHYFYELVKTIKSVATHNRNFMVWQEVFDRGARLDKSTIIQVWRSNATQELQEVTNSGYRAILSMPWFVSRISSNSDWRLLYKVEPLMFLGSDEQKRLVIGGEACMWGELVDGTNLISRMWPRTSAIAERLWSSRLLNNADMADSRLEEHRCRMISRGINAEPQTGPGFCEADYLV